MGIELEFGGFGAKEAEGALGIVERDGVFVARGVAVAKYERGEVVVVEEAGDGFAFMAEGQAAVAAAGENQHGSAGGLILGGEVDVEGGNGRIGFVLGSGDVGGGKIGPELDAGGGGRGHEGLRG